MPPTERDNRKQRIGAVGESIAARYLETRGYVIVERNYRRRWGEADIVASAPDDMLVIVEVRSRSDARYTVEAAQSVGPRKQSQLRKLARGLLSEQEHERDIRVDVIVVAPNERGVFSVAAHIINAVEDAPIDD